MQSTRLPGKVMIDLCGKPVIWHVQDRVKNSKLINQVVIATTIESADDIIEEFCITNHLNFFRGSQDDVLDRYNQAAKKFNADIIVRVTSDCPLIDPNIIDDVLKYHLENRYDVSGLSGEFPDGLDVEVFTRKSIEIAAKCSNLKSEREHIGQYFYKRPDEFRLGSFFAFNDKGMYRWTLDQEEDLDLVKKIYDYLYKEDKIFLTQEVFELIDMYPFLKEINSEILRNEGLLKSLEND